MWILSQNNETSINSDEVKGFNVETDVNRNENKIYVITAYYSDGSKCRLGAYSSNGVAKAAMKDLVTALHDHDIDGYEMLDNYHALDLSIR